MNRRIQIFAACACFCCVAALPSARATSGILYVLNDVSGGANQIYAFAANEGTGALTLLPGFPVPSGGNGNGSFISERMAVDAKNNRLFVVNGGSASLSAFSINPANGTLTALPFSPLVLGTDAYNGLSVHPSGSPVVVIDASTNSALSFTITGTTATPAAGSPYATGANPYSSAFSVDGNFFYTGGGSSSSNTFAEFSVNAASGVMTLLAGSPFDTGGSAPCALATDSAGRIFVANFNAPHVQAFVTTAGEAAAVNGNPFFSGVTSGAIQGVVHPNGFYLVADRMNNQVGVYQIAGTDVATTLTAVSGSPYATGQSFTSIVTLNSNGSFVYAANSNSRNVSGFNMTTSNGVLGAPANQPADTLGASGGPTGMAYFFRLASVRAAGNNQSAVVSTAYSTALQVAVTDATGGPASGVNVIFNAPSSGPSGTFANGSTTTTAISDANGIATASTFTANTMVGSFTVVGVPAISGTSGVPFSLTNTTAPPNAPPAVTLKASTTTQFVNVPVTFTLSATDPDTATLSYTLNFGDSTAPVTGQFAQGSSVNIAHAFTQAGTYAVIATVSDGTNNVSQSVTVAVPPPAVPPNLPPVVALQASTDAAFLNAPVTFTLSASDPDTATLSYTLNFGDGSAPALGQLAQGGSINLTHAFALPGTFTVTATVSDGSNAVSQSVTVAVPAPDSGGAGVTNVAQGQAPVSNPLNGITVAVLNSNGGVVQLAVDVNSLTRAAYNVQSEFGDIAGRANVQVSFFPVHKYESHGIFIATSIATDHTTGIFAGKARKTLAISTKETGEAQPVLDPLPARNLGSRAGTPLNVAPGVIVTTGFKGKFIFDASKSDSVSYSGMIALPAGLNTSTDQEFSIAIGNIVANTTVDKHGKAMLAKNDALLKSLKITYGRVKKGQVSSGGELSRVNVTLNMAGMVAAGFDTEGIATRGTDIAAGQSTPRSIQIAMLLGGTAYESQAPVTFALSKDSLFGTIQGRK